MTPLRVRALYRCLDCGAFRVIIVVLGAVDAHSIPQEAHCHWHPPYTSSAIQRARLMALISATIIEAEPPVGIA